MVLAFFVREQANKCPEDDWTAELLLPDESFDMSFFTIVGCPGFGVSQRLLRSSSHSPDGCGPLYMQRKDLVNIKQCPGIVVP